LIEQKFPPPGAPPAEHSTFAALPGVPVVARFSVLQVWFPDAKTEQLKVLVPPAPLVEQATAPPKPVFALIALQRLVTPDGVNVLHEGAAKEAAEQNVVEGFGTETMEQDPGDAAPVK
jgi:hypothetical protein